MLCQVQSHTFTTQYQYTGTTAKLRLYYTRTFIGSNSESVVAAAVGAAGWYDEVSCTVVGGQLVLPAFNLVATVDGTPPSSRVFGVLYSEDGVRRETLLGGNSGWFVPAQATITYPVLQIANRAVAIFEPLREYLTATDMLALLALTAPALHTASHQNGGSDELSVTGLSGLLADPQTPLTENVQDIVGAMMTDSAEIDFTYDDTLGTLTAALKAASIAYARIQNVSASDRLLGRATAGAGTIEEITCTAAGRALLDDAAASDQRTTLGLGALALLATIGTTQIDNDAVTYAKVQNVSAASRLLGRGDSGAGDPEELTLGTNLSMSGTTLNAAGGGGGAPTDATYITQTPNGTLSAEQAMSTLATGLVKNATGTGVQSIAAADSDYAVPRFIRDGLSVEYDRTPTTSQAEDDEFNSSSLNVKWTVVTNTVAAVDIDTTFRSHVFTRMSGINQSYIIEQNYAPAGDFTLALHARFAITTQNTCSVLFRVLDVTNAEAIVANYVTNSNVVQGRLDSLDAGVATNRASYTAFPSSAYGGDFYLYVERISNVWLMANSFDGLVWQRSATHAKTFTVDHFRVELSHGASATWGYAGLDWVRRDWITLT